MVYFPSILSIEEERSLLAQLSAQSKDWNTAGVRANRRVKHYGYNYPYSRKLELTTADPIPQDIALIISKLQKLPSLEDFRPDQAIINRYLTGEGISAHIDHTDLFKGTVVSVSLGCDSKMRFRRDDSTYDQDVARRSAYAMTGEARYKWTHEMPKSAKQCTTRYSITFREVNKQYVQ